MTAALLAFGQFVMAAEPCMLAHEPPPVQHEAMAEDRCDAMPMDRAACLTQCLAQDESVSTLSSLFTAVSSAPPPALDFSLAATQVARRFERTAPPIARPLQILYCSYQI